MIPEKKPIPIITMKYRKNNNDEVVVSEYSLSLKLLFYLIDYPEIDCFYKHKFGKHEYAVYEVLENYPPKLIRGDIVVCILDDLRVQITIKEVICLIGRSLRF